MDPAARLVRSPRVDGDVPGPGCRRSHIRGVAPGGRGYSLALLPASPAPQSCPVWTGMYPGFVHLYFGDSGLPRVDGDVPKRKWWWIWRSWVAPRRRGCSLVGPLPTPRGTSDPVWTGISPVSESDLACVKRWPSVDGDEPRLSFAPQRQGWVTPCRRGSPHRSHTVCSLLIVNPVATGMGRVDPNR